MGCGCCGKVLFWLAALWFFWFCNFLYGVSPYFWTQGDYMRSLREWRFWCVYTWYGWDYRNDHIGLQSIYIYPENFPDFTKDMPPQIHYVDHQNITVELWDACWLRGECILVWRNATLGKHNEIATLEWLRENMVMNTTYQATGDGVSYAYYNDSNWDTAMEYQVFSPEPVTMKDIIDHTLDGEHKAYYVGFSWKMAEENPKFRKKVYGYFDEIAETMGYPNYYTPQMGLLNPVGIPFLRELCFLYYGTEAYAPIHNGAADSTFLQLKNTKRWILIHPRYLPYMMPAKRIMGAIGLIDFPEIPRTFVDAGPGDLLHFPPHYIHMVTNRHEEWGMGFGMRDSKKSLYLMFMNTFFGSPIEANVGAMWHFVSSLIQAKLIKGIDLKKVNAARGAVDGASVPDIKYDAFQLQALHKHIADCHNQFEYLTDPTIERGVEIGRGRGHPNGVGGPNSGLAAVKTSVDARREWQEIRKKFGYIDAEIADEDKKQEL